MRDSRRSHTLVDRRAVLCGLILAFVVLASAATLDSTADAPPALANRAGEARIVTYAYDGAGRLVRANYGEVSIVYTYDAGGNLLRREVVETMKVYLPIVLKGA